MRLKKIKLVGFKSFVDPTTVEVSADLCAVVGPNGCGKSNIIDAIRWVMGESSAKSLRGGAATDVIFSGTSSRKPVGQASVELVFDNNKGMLGGEYASYSEISIKRVLTRDGQSSYLLNGSKCRRKDIVDIFLGTGLGPRSYSIIEQGMVSRLIEAKPEEFRIFLEEAAGISKYKERRRETENRIRHTRDNLDRLDDLRDELERQLKNLERQSEAANKYQGYQTELKRLTAELYSLRWQALQAKIQGYDLKIKEITAKQEGCNAKLQNIESNAEQQHLLKLDANENLTIVQKKYFALNGEISKLEQNIKHAEERLIELAKDLTDAKQELELAKEQQTSDKERLLKLTTVCQELEPEYTKLAAESEVAAEALLQAEGLMEVAQHSFTEVSEELSVVNKETEVLKAELNSIDSQSQHLQSRVTRLEEELAQLETESSQTKIDNLSVELAPKGALVVELESKFQLNKEQLHTNKQQLKQVEQELQVLQDKLQKVGHKKAGLDALQAASLGKKHAGVAKWLEEHDLASNQRLAEILKINSGWEIAVETVLGNMLEAVCVSDLASSVTKLDNLSKGSVILLDLKGGNLQVETQEKTGFFNKMLNKKLEPLAAKVENLPQELSFIFNEIFIANNLSEARKLLAELPDTASLVTKDGAWLGRSWIRVSKGHVGEHDGVLVREQELQQAAKELAGLEAAKEEHRHHIVSLQQEIDALEHATDALHKQSKVAQTEYNTVKSALDLENKHLEQLRQRVTRAETELSADRQKLQSLATDSHSKRANLESLIVALENLTKKKDELHKAKLVKQDSLATAKETAAKVAKDKHKLELELSAFTTEKTALEGGFSRSQKQIENWEHRISSLTVNLEDGKEPIALKKVELEHSLEQNLVVEQELSEARHEVESIEEKIRSFDADKILVQKDLDKVRSELESARLAWQGESVRLQSIEEHLAGIEANPEAVLQTMPAEANEKEWETQIGKLDAKIKALGAINLAAIEEFSAQSERKLYLDEQSGDLEQSLSLLESAIYKIDKETKARFKDTFDKVNQEFQTLFPVLFGGGKAYLELTGEDLLDTGVSIVARPPGKRNSILTQLSGGEKALTAVALVFAIFHLNPSPFCVLDEVDAPLDDTNVGRFCELVKGMSKDVQFIFISHNKIAIEMAEQLLGVTMREAGVSRLVTVNMEEATKLAEA